MRNKNILIFGSTGFIGRSLIKRLLSQLNANFFNFWKFEIVVDTHSSNMKIIDINSSAGLDKNPTSTKTFGIEAPIST